VPGISASIDSVSWLIALISAVFGGFTQASMPPPNPNCPLAQPGSEIGMTLPDSCTVIASDTGVNEDPAQFWGRIDCEDPQRQQLLRTGGDTHETGAGESQGNTAFRRLRVLDGDNVYGERCELGENDMSGPTAFYREGERRVTYMSIRLPDSWNVDDPKWRVVMQMKQAEPYHNPDVSSIFQLEADNGTWHLISSWSNPLWSAPARTGIWTRFAFDVTYSSDPAKGLVRIYVDLNDDGDFDDSGEASPLIHHETLKAEVPGGDSPYLPGQSIHSHLREGVYQDTRYSCPHPAGCYADYDNVQVIRP
jgi:hypothetical protein